MSNEAVKWSMKQPTGSSGTRQLLMVLADAVRDTPTTSPFGRNWPAMHAYLSIASLCERTLQNRKTVITNLQRLEQGNFIQRTGTDGITNQTVVFKLLTKVIDEVGPPVPKTEPVQVPETVPVPKTEPVPISDETSTVFDLDQSRFFTSPVPKTGHETLLNPIEPNKPKKTRANTSHDVLDFADLVIDVEKQVLNDFIMLRTAKKAKLTRTALEDIGREAQKARLTMNEALTMCCSRGWQGFRATWIVDRQGHVKPQSMHSGFDKIDYQKGVNDDGSFV